MGFQPSNSCCCCGVKVSRKKKKAASSFLFLEVNNATPNHFTERAGMWRVRHVKLCNCHTAGWSYRLFIFTRLTIHTADVTAMRTTLHQEIPHHLSVNTDDLFHTFSGLCTTLLLPSRQMSQNKHYHSDTKLCFHCTGRLHPAY